eukprot:503452_1
MYSTYIFCIVFLRLVSSFETSAVVDTVYGTIEGNITSMGRTFTGIPFADPPIDDLRWMPPIPPKQWNNILQTNELPPQCPQSCDDGNTTYWCAPTTSEDCLYINVWTLHHCLDYAGFMEVTHMSFVLLKYLQAVVYSGGFTVGYGAGLLKNGTKLANLTNSIVVSMNYRVGAIGFYYDENLDILGNFGYLDQVFAIEWVYNNIKAFGGNPEQITIFGESAGAASVDLHLLNQTALYKAAIVESGGGEGFLTTDYWNNGISDAFSSKCGCNTHQSKQEQLKCLKSLKWETIVEVQKDFGMSPTVNTTLFPINPLFMIQKGDFNTKVPFIIGTNLGEHYFSMAGVTNVSYDQLTKQLNVAIGEENTKLTLEFYNCTNKPVDYNFLNETANIFTDFQKRCPSRNLTASQALYGNKNGVYSYFYHFAHVSSFIDVEPGCNPLCNIAPCHTTEIPYVFNDNLTPIGIQFTSEEKQLAEQFQFYWSNLAANLDPNKGHSANIKWTPYDNENRE